MFVFGNDSKMRGCFATFNLFTAGGKGAYLQLPSGDTIPQNSTLNVSSSALNSATDAGHDPIIVTGMSFAQKEKYHLVQCFSDYTYTYAFGHDPMASMLEVNFVGFLVNDAGTDWSNVVQDFTDSYKAGRLVESKQYAKVFIGSGRPLGGFIVGMQCATADAHHNLQNFTMMMLLAEAQGS
jgi:hypothetical protein